ncbi:hypothetical protein LU293_00110 [Moraxella nasovis]|uniref:hypothetical protein n=1 Tax=Moraxella nasovis TaxID=2904121 RepID=UPI001F61FE3D|nr:hypothetical protein [Moraxella nasovis]UNU73356.1 hypothetical protein LU293_00110 [Moraxella nasovis]
MANISDAYGSLIITTQNPQILETLTKVFTWLDENQHSFIYGFWVEKSQFKDGLQDGISYPFVGFGRWCMSATLRDFLTGGLDDEFTDELKKYDWDMELAYHDYEPGLQFLVRQTVKLGYKKQEPFFELYINAELPYTAKNLNELGFVEMAVDAAKESHPLLKQLIVDTLELQSDDFDIAVLIKDLNWQNCVWLDDDFCNIVHDNAEKNQAFC